MPLIKDEDRAQFEETLQALVEKIKGLSVVIGEQPDKYISYIMYSLIKEFYDFNDIEQMIHAVGILEETKLALYTLEVLPMEQKIIARRWYDGDASR